MIPKNYLEIKNDDRGSWLKLVYHNSANEVFFKNEIEAQFTISEQKYSILKLIDKVNRYDKRKYEFLLEYPEYPEGYNWWTQIENPLNVKLGDNVGYEEKKLTWPGAKFGGLIYDISKYTYLKGSYDDELWFYAICSYNLHNYKDKFPGPRIDNEQGELVEEIDVKEMYLWIRIANSYQPFLTQCTLKPPFFSFHSFLPLITILLVAK